ncbi:MAG TPA: hypothetical protein VMP67_06160 [Candidatus Limnocylindria bacterium]|nr:hypothetical protein [Candidatus Limnocylindria bacterium]
MPDKRLPKERVFTPQDVARARAEGKVYDATVVDFVPLEVPADEAELLVAAGWQPPSAKKARKR